MSRSVKAGANGCHYVHTFHSSDVVVDQVVLKWTVEVGNIVLKHSQSHGVVYS